ncbi:hypothetical protein [uncultured Corynebacterium sp.]|uniref:hypothetical protein n=1 Tax=uncultured Corynebacterium sp. TaxID=159447 RepID=UPI002592637A|nr:hypothetical protein [uncultured Corynebacterium sp.]
MVKIKNDFFGVVYARKKNGELVKLRAGDTVPSSVEVRDDLHAPTTKGGSRAKSTAADRDTD